MGNAKAAIDRMWTALEAKDLADIRGLCDESVEVVMPGGMTLRGPDQIVSLLQTYIEAFPDMHHQVVDYVDAGSKVAVELRITGTHTGPMQTPNGVIPPTGKRVVWQSVDLVTVSGDKIVTWHTYYDQLSFLMQLGLVPEPAAA